jgi:hypothetical protein
MNTTRETVEPAMRAAAEDVCGDYVEIVPADTRNLMGFFIGLRKLLAEVSLLNIAIRRLKPDRCMRFSVESTTSPSQTLRNLHMSVS